MQLRLNPHILGLHTLQHDAVSRILMIYGQTDDKQVDIKDRQDPQRYTGDNSSRDCGHVYKCTVGSLWAIYEVGGWDISKSRLIKPVSDRTHTFLWIYQKWALALRRRPSLQRQHAGVDIERRQSSLRTTMTVYVWVIERERMPGILKNLGAVRRRFRQEEACQHGWSSLAFCNRLDTHNATSDNDK